MSRQTWASRDRLAVDLDDDDVRGRIDAVMTVDVEPKLVRRRQPRDPVDEVRLGEGMRQKGVVRLVVHVPGAEAGDGGHAREIQPSRIRARARLGAGGRHRGSSGAASPAASGFVQSVSLVRISKPRDSYRSTAWFGLIPSTPR